MRFNWPKIKASWLKWKLDYLSLLAIALFYYGRLQWNIFFGDPDAFYHTKIALFLRQGILLKSLPWMQTSTLAENFTDHHLLYHLILTPFTYIIDPVIGVKIASVLFAAIMIVVFYWLLKKMHISWPWALTLLVISCQGLTFRLTLIKVTALSLIMTYFLIYALYQKKPWLLIIIGFIFVWLYGGWPLAILISLLYFIAHKIYYRLHPQKIKNLFTNIVSSIYRTKNRHLNYRIFLFLILGIILGLIINPYWPHNLYFYYQQIIQVGIINFGYSFPVGSEWYGASLKQIIYYSSPVFTLGFLTFIALAFVVKRVSARSWFSFLLAFTFFILTAKSRRYLEYYLPFMVLFIGCGLSDLKNIISWQKLKKIIINLKIYFKICLMAGLVGLLILIWPAIYKNIFRPMAPDNWPRYRYVLAIDWLKNNVPSGTLVYNGMWDFWAILFYFDDSHYYLIGLDPTFMHNYDADLTKLYFALAKGEDNVNVIDKIKERFKTNYVFVSKNKSYQTFVDNLKNEGAKILYEDEEAIIYYLK